ncbi:MAG: sulfotransferase [Cyanobacteria bacterium P01_D01_bin.105]
MVFKELAGTTLSQILTFNSNRLFKGNIQSAPAPPIFLLGMTGRTGTNFFSRLLAHHPKCIQCHIHEGYLLKHITLLNQYTEETLQQWHTIMPADQLPQSLARFQACLGEGLVHYLEALTSENLTPNHRCSHFKGQRLIIKTPSVENIDKFFQFFPDSPLLLLVRDGKAVVESQARSFNYDREILMHRWAKAADRIIQFEQAQSNNSKQYRIFKYETLHTQTTQEISNVLAFLNLDKSDYPFQSALSLTVTGSSTFGRTSGQPISWQQTPKTTDFDPLNRASNWTISDRKKFSKIAGEQMRYFDYPL